MNTTDLTTPQALAGEQPVPTERAHHPYSPSTLQATEFCPCYRSRQSDKPHVRTVAGTRAHAVAETGEDDHRLTDEDAVAAAECLDFVEQRRALLQEAADRLLAKDVDVNLNVATTGWEVQELKEVYLPIDDLEFSDCKATTAGYTDHVLVSHDQSYLEGFDWKFGFWPVEPPASNLQVISYTLGLFKMFPQAQVIRFWIRQPHLDVTDSAVFKREQIPELYLRVQVVVARAREARAGGDFALAVPSTPNCNFCNLLGTCTAVCKFACEVGKKFHPLEIPEDITPSALQAPEQAALGLRLAAVLKIWSDAFRRQITDRILRREMDLPPGQKIQVITKREIVDLDKVKAVALHYLTLDEFYSTLETTFGSLETLIQDKAPRGMKKAMVEEFQTGLEAAGAVKRGEPISFLRAVTPKE